METDKEGVAIAAGLAVHKQVKNVRTLKALRHIRMMVGQEGIRCPR